MAIGQENKQLLRNKADLAMSDLVTGSAKLPTEQALRFTRKLLDTPTMLGDIRVVGMKSHTKMINKIGFDNRIMKAAAGSATALDAADRSKPDLSTVLLTTERAMAEIRLPYEVVEDIIESANIGAGNGAALGGDQVTGQFKNTIMDLIAERAALDIEELILLGDQASGDAYLALFDGFLKLASTNGHTVDASGLASSVISREMFKKGIQTMPQKYLRNRAAMKHYISHSNDAEYRDLLASRQTAQGDSFGTGVAPIYSFGVPVKIASLMPDDEGLFTNPKNLIMGIYRDIMLETDKDIRTQEYIIVLSFRIGVTVEEDDALLYYGNITSA